MRWKQARVIPIQKSQEASRMETQLLQTHQSVTCPGQDCGASCTAAAPQTYGEVQFISPEWTRLPATFEY